ncbi:DUF1173 family protein [Paraburkholderia sp. SIMBA_054]|uniref:DUF1173 family protein n=1 Tax=Paraburkholderia sp. SIMBA_054 TaxID=3085795 RepID=UPI00397A370A
MTNVYMGGRRFSLEDLQAEPARHAHWFERARAEAGFAECLCSTPRLRLQIRLRDGLFHLAGWPNEGESHDQASCFFHKQSPQSSGRGDYASAAIIDRDDGSADIKVEAPLKLRSADRAPSLPRGTSENGPGHRRRSVGMLGLLHELWEAASLNRWGRGWSRNWSRCRWGLLNIDRRINGVSTRECMYVVHAWEPARKDQIEQEFSTFRARLGPKGEFRHRGYVLGELKGYQATEYGYRIELRHQRTSYFASKQLIEALETSARAVVAARDNPDTRTVVLMLVDVTAKGYLQVVDMALMLTTKNYIPCESSYEVQMANALTDAGRSFVKPLRYDTIESTFPDFKLLDTVPQTVVEVLGMMNMPSYVRRKKEKDAIYRANKVPVIAWDTRQPMPDLRVTSGVAKK